MLKTFKQFVKERFTDNNALTKPNSHDIALAAATLMFEVVKSDSDIHLFENQQMAVQLQRQFGLSREEIADLVALAENVSDKTISLQGFTRQLCDAWNNSQRCELIEDLWFIALADGKIDAHERHVIRKIAALLYLTDRQIILAKEAAKLRS
tara:strand:+ start:1510 stop:1965 length:456 start_codon:yes stop_codon:yes gene_type:complete